VAFREGIMSNTLPPDFFLYGEAAKSAGPDFVHVEDLAERSKPGNWRIAPHKHADLCHFILITKGGGNILYESELMEFSSPRLLIVPANSVHGFSWQAPSEGQVLTVALPKLQQLSAEHEGLGGLFTQPGSLAVDDAACKAIGNAMQAISQELAWTGLGQSAALQAGLLNVLVQAARQLQMHQKAPKGTEGHHRLVARFRQLVEERFRLREPVSTYARALAVSETSLRDACAATGQSPTAIRDQRAVLEAQRLLAFSAMPVADIGDSIGIEDPAYFSRFFTRHCGMSPARWRRERIAARQLA